MASRPWFGSSSDPQFHSPTGFVLVGLFVGEEGVTQGASDEWRDKGKA